VAVAALAITAATGGAALPIALLAAGMVEGLTSTYLSDLESNKDSSVWEYGMNTVVWGGMTVCGAFFGPEMSRESR